MTALVDWIGRQQTRRDTLAPLQAQRMQATLGQSPQLGAGDPLPPLWHWIYFQDHVATPALGPDGHPPRGDFLPPVALPRRMWAGGRFGFTAHPTLGATLTRSSSIKSIREKTGATGALCFVTVHHAYADGSTQVFWEEHDIVYRDAPVPGARQPSPPPPPHGAEVSRTVAPSMPLLFRYSAVTFNTHRIHYDLDYCREEEGYPGCVVHGPLIATLLAGLATQVLGAPLSSFSFRATAPIFHDRPFSIHARSGADGLTLWAECPDGGQAMLAAAT